MTTYDPERLDRIERLVEANTRGIAEVRKLTESNARAIQALGDQIAEASNTLTANNLEAQAERAELRRAMIGLANLMASLDQDRPTILRKLNTIETKIDQLLEQNQQEQSSDQA